MNKRLVSGLVNVTVSLVFVGAAAWVVLNRQGILDWWNLLHYTPTADVQRLATEDQLAPRGKDLFYVSEPQIEDAGSFNTSCSSLGEKSIVLGCYKAQRIYLFNVTDTRLNGVKEVTAAHEMLHAAYERLSDGERQHVNAMLKPVIDGMKDPRILDLIKLYSKEEPGQLYNEMHSILGTEYSPLTSDLEDYYKQYFTDRSKIVAFSDQYQAVFTASKTRLAQYDSQLAGIKAQIDQNNATLEQKQTELEGLASQLNALRTQGNIQAYNQAVPGYNAKVSTFNTLVTQTRNLVNQYNQIVAERNQQAAAQNNLYQSLDSHYQPALQN